MESKARKSKIDLKEYEDQILKGIDWRREYEAMGVRFSGGGSPDTDGWLECFALFRDEDKPSAAVNVASKNGLLGLYTDLGSDKSRAIRPWEVMAQRGLAPSWQEARDRLAEKARVEKPKAKRKAASIEEREKELKITPITNYMAEGYLGTWIGAKPGIAIEAVRAAGGEPVVSCFGPCIRFQVRDPADLTKICGSILYRWDGADFPASSDGKIKARKVHNVGGHDGKKIGLVLVGPLEQFATAEVVLICEGTTDALAAYKGLPPGWIAISGTGGAKKFTKELAQTVRGKKVVVAPDADEPGQQGAEIACRSCFGIAIEIKNAKLPYDVTPNHGKDLRDLVIEGRFAEWLAGVEALAPLADEKTVLPPILEIEGQTEIEMARRLAKQFGERFRWVQAWDSFRVWDGRRWAPDERLELIEMAKQVHASLWREVKSVPSALLDETDEMRAKSFIRAMGSKRGIDAMISLARSEPGIPKPAAEFDSNPMLFNCRNCTIDLGKLDDREHRREDHLTQLAGVEVQAKATCPLWDAFIATITNNDKALAIYAQKAVGMCLSGLVQEHVLFFCYGTGQNGKSTFLNTILAMMGDYGMKAPPGLLMRKKHESHPTERADLHGKRFVSCIEAEEGQQLAESLVKELTGGDSVRARHVHQDHFEFTPTHKIWLAANHKPVIRGTDEGIWRRIKLIPFTVSIPPAKQDKQLPQKLLGELPGILMWAAIGFDRWRQEGLQEPPSMVQAVENYRDSMDTLGDFLIQRCDEGENFSVRAKDLYDAFISWSGQHPSLTVFGLEMEKRGFEKRRSNGIRYDGIRMKPLEIITGAATVPQSH